LKLKTDKNGARSFRLLCFPADGRFDSGDVNLAHFHHGLEGSLHDFAVVEAKTWDSADRELDREDLPALPP
jgi:hypothetical protein